MKKILFLLGLVLLACVSLPAQSLVAVTAVKKNTTAIDTVAIKLNPAFFQYVKKGATDNYIGYQNFYYPNRVDEYTVTDKFDSIVNRANRTGAKLVKLLNSTLVYQPRRDTVIQWAYPVPLIYEVQPATVTLQPTANSVAVMKYANYSRSLYFNETATIIATRVDSLCNVSMW